jgi:hypothetical protein
VNEQGANVPRATDEQEETMLRNGYLFWGIVIGAILLTEVLGASEGWLQKHIHDGIRVPWPTISFTVGHLEDRWTILGAVVLGLIVAVTFYALAYRGPDDDTVAGRTKPQRGRPVTEAGLYTWWLALLPAAIAGFVAKWIWDEKLFVGYAIYGSLAVFGVLLPSLLILVVHKKVGFPTLFYMLQDLRKHHRWTSVVLITGLGILAVHLAFYPWPDITKEPAEYAGLNAISAKAKGVKELAKQRGGTKPKLFYSSQIRGIDDGEEAWLVFFSPAKDSGLRYSGCYMVVTDEQASATPECLA